MKSETSLPSGVDHKRGDMAKGLIRYWAAARAAAGVAEEPYDATTLEEALTAARAARGDEFARVIARSSFLVDAWLLRVPTLVDCLAWFECEVTRRLEIHDHTVFVARVLSCGGDGGSPLLFYGSGYHCPELPIRR